MRRILPALLLTTLLAGTTAAQTPPQDHPCRVDERHREFDFWIGDWDVFDPEGKPVGRNTIRSDVDGCMLLESWQGAGGSVGQSINFIDPESARWRQIWVDGGGGLIEIEGRFDAGSMRLLGTHTYRNGRKLPFRGTWTILPDGRVRQHFEESKDDGKTWPTWFEGYYVRRGDARQKTDELDGDRIRNLKK